MKTYACDACGRISTTTRADDHCYWCGNATHVSPEDAVEISIPKSQVGTDYIAVVHRGKVVDILLSSDRNSISILGNDLVKHLQEYVDKLSRGDPRAGEDSDGDSSQAIASRADRAMRILVVDDEEAMREIVVSMLAADGHQCREAAGGLEALALLESGERFDLMLTNLMMPRMHGIALLECTKKKAPDLPVVLVTSVHDISVALATIRNGAFDYLLIPFERKQLLAVVRRALEYRRFEQEKRAYVSGLESKVASLTEQLRVKKS